MIASSSLEAVGAGRRAALAIDPGTGSRLLGHPGEVSLNAAVFTNGVASAVLEYDDTHIESFIHSTATPLSVALAECQKRHLPGTALLEAVLVGSELTSRLGRITPTRLHNLGFHPTAVLGVFGAVFALGKLRALSVDQLVNALGAAGSMSAGLIASFEDGSSTKTLHVGLAALSAVRAVTIAQHGISGPKAVFEGRFGWFRSHVQGRDDFRFQALTENLGSDWEVLNIAPKLYPCAFTMMPHIAAAIRLRTDHDFALSDVVGIDAFIGARSIATMCEPSAEKRRPATSWQGRISLQHTVAEALVNGRMDKNAYSEASLRDPETNRLADLVSCHPDTAFTNDQTRSGGEVRVRLRSGKTLRHRIDDMAGTRRNPIAPEDVLAKFRSNVVDDLTSKAAETLIHRLLDLENVSDVDALFDVAAR